MRRVYVLWPVLAAGLLVGAVRPSAAQTVDVEGLRREIEQLRKELETVQQQYGERLAALEARLGAA